MFPIEKVLAFQVQASDDCINISACGYFKITKDVVPAVSPCTL